MFSGQVTICRFFGFDIRIDASWLVLAILIVWTFSTKYFPATIPGLDENTYTVLGFAALGLILVSILAHELAHAVIAEYYHMPITGITLFIFGGVAEMQGEPSHPKGEFFMAIAGPLMSAFLMILFWSSAYVYKNHFSGSDAIYELLTLMAQLNFLIVVFNLIPAFPLDGGRALRSIVWRFKGNLVLATRIASELGKIMAYGLILYGCWQIVHDQFWQGMWWGLIGFFLNAAGNYAVHQTEFRTVFAGQPVSRFMRKNFITVTPDTTVAELVDDYVYNYYHRSFPVIDQGKLAGIVTLESVMMLDRRRWQWLRVAAVMEPLGLENTTAPDDDTAQIIDRMRRANKKRLLVVDKGELVGVLSLRELIEFLKISVEMDDIQAVVAGKRTIFDRRDH